MKELAAIVLAAGEGKRMESKDVNKVTLPLGGKPMILHTVDLLRQIEASPITIVVGFAKDSVKSLLDGDIVFVEQAQRLGTANAVEVALREMPQDMGDVLILQGDDSALYKREIIEALVNKHRESNAAFTFLTINVDNPTGLGRIIRNREGKLEGIIEEKDATFEQKQIREINPACYVADIQFLRKYLPQVEKSPVTGEYYLTSLIDIGIRNNEIVETLTAGNIPWRGVNTKDELQEAERMLSSRE
ncbi:MAG TPA: NTP transferase domain-containing protein [Patescibacteria group bacterium]|jgi:bifunctional UDP-N-acetylglucosamine pyrophosphorylase/glucosamine-1-phosphate N-acetyltransferase|nr:NTP transferase domain-containing protein [Patescibacteria group bacterium]